MGPNLTSFGGTIRTGVYGTITLVGSHTLERGVRFAALIVNGNVQMTDCIGGRIQCASGDIHCDGSMQVSAITGDGHLHVGHDMRCKTLDFVGSLDAHGHIRCDAELRLVGSLTGGMDITAQRLEINGVLDARNVRAHDIRIVPFSSPMLSRHGAIRHARISQAGKLRASSIHVECLTCALAHGDAVIVGDGCTIGHIIYKDDCRLSPSATVTRIEGQWPAGRALRRA